MTQTIKTMKDLQNEKQWVCWRYEERDGNKTKVPYNPRTGGKAMSNNPDTWTTFDYAKSKADSYNGIGFMFANGICGIDIDNKTGNPELDEQAETVINLMNTHTERSPSGTGYHLIFRCDMSKIPQMTVKENSKDKIKLDGKYYVKNPYNDLECYFSGLTNRFFTYTGNSVNAKNIENRTNEVLYFLENYMLRDKFKAKNTRQERTEENKSGYTTDDVLEIARNDKYGADFIALYDRGDISAYNHDDSAADLALCKRLAYYLQGDFNEIDRYFRQSALCQTKERIEKWNRVDYRTATINKAIEIHKGKYYTPKKQAGRPKKEKHKKEYTPEQEEILKQVKNDYGVYDDEEITISAVAFYLEQNSVTLKYNETIRKTEITGINKYNNNYIVDNFPIVAYNDLKLQYKKCTINVVQDFLKVIMMNNAYNPILELIQNNKWDGVDRLPELYRILGIAKDDELSRTLIRKWHWQNLSMLRNEKGVFGADGLLVLQSEQQGIGKTTYARKAALKNEWFGEGLTIDVRDKDSIINAVSCWVGELGEIESTFKSDVNALKAFITKANDQYRVPYGRTAETLPRRTSFIGTCNSTEFLIDETGNRRYWTVPINNIDLDALEKFDMLQLYLQIDERDARNNIQGFRLTKEERADLNKRNREHEKALKGEIEICDILYAAERDPNSFVWEEMTVTEFKLLFDALKIYTSSQIGKVLKKIGIKAEKEYREKKQERIAVLPRPKNRINAEDFKPKI